MKLESDIQCKFAFYSKWVRIISGVYQSKSRWSLFSHQPAFPRPAESPTYIFRKYFHQHSKPHIHNTELFRSIVLFPFISSLKTRHEPGENFSSAQIIKNEEVQTQVGFAILVKIRCDECLKSESNLIMPFSIDNLTNMYARSDFFYLFLDHLFAMKSLCNSSLVGKYHEFITLIMVFMQLLLDTRMPKFIFIRISPYSQSPWSTNQCIILNLPIRCSKTSKLPNPQRESVQTARSHCLHR